MFFHGEQIQRRDHSSLLKQTEERERLSISRKSAQEKGEGESRSKKYERVRWSDAKLLSSFTFSR
jgi:hypothetical protein